jgi:hypothetical protein
VSASWFLSLFFCLLFFFSLCSSRVFFFPSRLVFWTALWFWPLVGGCSDTVASGRTAYVTFKDPKALEIALLLSVWLCSSICLTCWGDFFCLFRSSVCRIRILFQMCCVGDCHYVK